MKVFSINDNPVINNPVATIGIFDGVHKGHKFILNTLNSLANQTGGNSLVISLWPHPRIVLNKDIWNFRLLHSQEEKIHHLNKLGLEYYVTIPFTSTLAGLNACEFVEEYLVKKLKVKHLLLGYDNAFGKDRKGDPDGLSECASKHGLVIHKLAEYTEEGVNISSTAVRTALLEGDLDAARGMLDYDYYLEGQVVKGNQLGRKLGYPTANIHPQSPYKLIPRDGVYAVHIEMENNFYPAMLNIGIRPTIDSANPVKTIEAHIFDLDIDLYETDIIIHFRKRIRNEMKFPGLESLKQQLQQDEQVIRKYLSNI